MFGLLRYPKRLLHYTWNQCSEKTDQFGYFTISNENYKLYPCFEVLKVVITPLIT